MSERKPLDLGLIKQMCAEADAGPWGWKRLPWVLYVGRGPQEPITGDYQGGCVAYNVNREANAAFIAAARESVPLLVAEVEALRKALRKALRDRLHRRSCDCGMCRESRALLGEEAGR